MPRFKLKMAGKFPYTPPATVPASDISLTATSWASNAAVNSTVATISATDADPGDTQTYTLPTNPGGKYSISGSSLKVAQALAAGSSVIAITATDSHGNIFTKDFNITVTPAPDYGIDEAEAEILAAYDGMWAGLAANETWDTDVTVTSAAALSTALAATRSTASGSIAITRKHRIVCDWNGISTNGAATSNISANGYSARTDGHSDNGGGIYVVAASGKTPAIGNMVNMAGTRGIHWKGIGFAREWSGSGAQENQYGAQTQTNATFIARPVVIFEDCPFGAGYWNPGAADTQWIGGYNSSGLPDYLYFKNCIFDGHENILKAKAKKVKIEGCDFRGAKQDFTNFFGHTSETGYYCYIWFERNTFRRPADGVDNRNNHMDIGQTGTSGDIHLGYKVIWRNVIAHANHSYAGDPGQGGGTQGSYNDDHVTADNQYVIRDCIIAVSSPNAFHFHSPNASKPSFIDSCTFMRSGMVPSSLPGDVNSPQDFGVGAAVSGVYPPPTGTTWLYVTNTIGFNFIAADARYSVSMLPVDPRNTSTVTDVTKRPESVFQGTFTRGEYIAGKLSYSLPHEETGTQAEFVQDMWDMFEPAVAHAGWGAPDPTSLF